MLLNYPLHLSAVYVYQRDIALVRTVPLDGRTALSRRLRLPPHAITPRGGAARRAPMPPGSSSAAVLGSPRYPLFMCSVGAVAATTTPNPNAPRGLIKDLAGRSLCHASRSAP
jgi:hypothetical protein